MKAVLLLLLGVAAAFSQCVQFQTNGFIRVTFTNLPSCFWLESSNDLTNWVHQSSHVRFQGAPAPWPLWQLDVPVGTNGYAQFWRVTPCR